MRWPTTSGRRSARTPRREFRDPSELLIDFPNVRSVNVGNLLEWQPAGQIRAWLAGLEHLEYLRLETSYPNNDLDWLKSLVHLRRLDLQPVGRVPDLSSLTALPQLESLTLRDADSYQRRLPEIASLSHLRTLAIIPPRGADHAAPDPAIFAVLRRATELQAFYFGDWRFGQQQNPASGIGAVLPAIEVLPAEIRFSHNWYFFDGTIALLAGALAYQLGMQFHGPASRVVPGFVRAQVLTAALFWLASVTWSAWLLIGMGQLTIVAIAVSAAIMTAAVAFGVRVLADMLRSVSVRELASDGRLSGHFPVSADRSVAALVV